MYKKHIPLRKCIGCGEMKPKSKLIRIVKSLEENNQQYIYIDLTGKRNGRGAYICKNLSCLNLCRKTKRLERAFSTKIDETVYKCLEEELVKSD